MGGAIISESGGGIIPLRGAASSRNWGAASSGIRSAVILSAFSFRSWKDNDPLLIALDVVRELHARGAKKLPPHPPTSFLRSVWRKVVKTPAGIDRRAYEVAVMMALRDRLQSDDVWVEGSRAFRAFNDFLLPRDAFETSRRAGELALQLHILATSESMDHHDSEIMDDGRIDRGDA